MSISNGLISTRGVEGHSVPLRTAILGSQPEDKGLFIFPQLPYLGLKDIESLVNKTYPERAKTILGLFDFGIPPEQLNKIIDDTYGAQWDDEKIVPVTKLGFNNYLLELYHGPTQAFKDVALQFLPRILSAYRQPGETLRALGASSGDTISAAHFGAGDVEGLQSCFLLPQNGPSEIQRLQATAHGFQNAITILIEGSFDDGQKVIKEILTNPRYTSMKEANNFISFNSINIARILAQIVYYFHAYCELIATGNLLNGDPINFSVPSGNFGDTLAGVYARKMGLPVNKVNVATNENDVLHQFLRSGRYVPGRHLIQTLAPSQDITVASNFERMIYEIIPDPQRVVALMDDLSQQGYFEVTPQELRMFQGILTSTTTTDSDINQTIRRVYQTTDRVIDPHTATGVHGQMEAFWAESGTIPTVCLATADHIKFTQPQGVPRDEQRYNAIVAPLKENTENYLVSKSDESSIIQAVQEAVQIINTRTGEQTLHTEA